MPEESEKPSSGEKPEGPKPTVIGGKPPSSPEQAAQPERKVTVIGGGSPPQPSQPVAPAAPLEHKPTTISGNSQAVAKKPEPTAITPPTASPPQPTPKRLPVVTQ